MNFIIFFRRMLSFVVIGLLLLPSTKRQSLFADDVAFSLESKTLSKAGPELLTIGQYRALMERDLHRQRANEAMLRKDWSAMKKASLAALSQEKIAYGADFKGDEITKAALTLAYLQNGEVSALVELLPHDESASKELLTLLVDGDHPREKTVEFVNLMMDTANDSVTSEQTEATILSKLERLNELATELDILDRMPMISWQLANRYVAQSDREKALFYVRQAYHNAKDERNRSGYTPEVVVTYGRLLLKLLIQAADEYGAVQEFDRLIPLRQEILELARELGEGVGPAERTLAVCLRVSELSAEDRKRIEIADQGIKNVWANVAKRNVTSALNGVYDARQTFREVLGADSDRFAYCTKVAGFLHWNLAQFDIGFERLVLASELLVKSRGPNDKLTHEAVSDACVNAIAAAPVSRDPIQLLQSVCSFETFVSEAFVDNKHFIAMTTACRLHVERIASLSSDQRMQLPELYKSRTKRNELYGQGKYAQAAVVAEKIVEQSEQLLGTDNRLFHEDLFSLANCQNQAMNFEASEISYRRLMLVHDRAPFNLLPDFAEHLQWYADMLQRAGRIDEAVEMLTKTKLAIELSIGKQSTAYANLLRVQSAIYTDKMFQPALALPLLNEATETLGETIGKENYTFCQSLLELGNCERMLLHNRVAEQYLKDSLAIRRRLPLSDKGQTALNLNSLGQLLVDTNRAIEAVELFQEAIALKEQINPEASDLSAVYANLICALLRKGDRNQATSWFEKLQTTRRKYWVVSDPRHANDLIRVGSAIMTGDGYFFQGFQNVSREDAEFIEPLFLNAARIYADAFGDLSWQHAEALHRLGCLKMLSGRAPESIPIFLKAQANAASSGQQGIKLRALVSAALSIAMAKLGDYVRALPIRLETTKMFEAIDGKQSANVANSLLATAQIYTIIGDGDRAEATTREAAEIFTAIGHPRQNDCYLSLAQLYLHSGDLDRAEQYLYYITRAEQSQSGISSDMKSAALLSLTRLYFARNGYQKVIESAELALTSEAINNLSPSLRINFQEMTGIALVRQGEFGKAEGILNSVLTSRIEQPSSDPLANQRAYRALSELQMRKGDLNGALKWARESLTLAEQHLNSVSAILSERQQLLLRATVRDSVDRYISLALQSGSNEDDLYSLVLRWKGGVFLRQRSIKESLQNASPETKQLVDELTAINRQLSSVAFNSAGNSSADWTDSMKNLTNRKELLEGQLSQLDTVFKATANPGRLMALDFVNRMPSDVVLVDFLNFNYFAPFAATTDSKLIGEEPAIAEERLLMFVLCQGHPIIVKDLGRSELIESDILKWRLAVMNSKYAEFVSIGNRLRQTLLSNVESVLTSEANAGKTVLISPDGALSQLAFAALPGRSDGTFMLENYRVATIAVPQLLLEQSIKKRPSSDLTSENMILLGNIDFSGQSGQVSDSLSSRAAPSRSLEGKQMTWQPLPGTEDEIESIRKTVEEQSEKSQVRILTGSEATESALRQRVPDAHWLHFATHGFFADVETKSSLSRQVSSRSLDATVLGRESIPGFDPGLLTGLVLSGANRIAEPGSDDGILTAVEISEMDLRQVELTVLSACETGLGESSGGEGVLGLQRSLQLAGCRSVVASLWKVDDQATKTLMQQFYLNVWKNKLGKLEALRQAQISMLRKYNWQEGTLRGDRRLSPTIRPDDLSQTPPEYWAAFVLSGEWR